MPQLTPEQLSQLDTNIKSMLENGGTQADVENYAKDFREKYDVKKKDSQSLNGTKDLPPQSEQELQPFKSPTQILNEFSGGGNLVPDLNKDAALPKNNLQIDRAQEEKIFNGEVSLSPNEIKNRPSLQITDKRVSDAATGAKIVDSAKKNSKVDVGLVSQIVIEAKKAGVDPYTALAMSLQETGLTNEWLDNPFHLSNATQNNVIRESIGRLKEKYAYAERLGKKTEAEKIQAWNGYGKITPSSELGGNMYYGIDVSKQPLDMSKNPVYGKRIIDLRDNVLKQNPEIVSLVEDEEKEPFKSPTTILSESGGGGSFFPDDVKGGAALPEPPITLEQYFQKNQNIIVPKENALSPFQLKTVQQQQNDVRMIGADIAKTTPERQDPNIQQALKKLQVNPNDDAAIYQLGYGNLGINNTAAQNLFEKALQVNPNNYKAKIGLADISFTNGDFDAALQYRQDAMGSIPKTVVLADGKEYNNPDYANNVLGIVQAKVLKKQDPYENDSIIDGILKTDPKNVLALQLKAEIANYFKRSDEAKKYTWDAVAANSENTPAPTLYNLEQKWKREHPEADEDTFIAQWLQSHADVANKIAMEMGGNQGAGEFVANLIDPVGYVMGNIEGVKQGLHHMGEGIAQMNESSQGTKAHVVGLTKAILGGTEATFATLMTTPHGFVFVQGLHGADMLSEDEASKYIMAPITTMFPVQDELGQNIEAIGDLAINLIALGATHKAIKGDLAGAKKIREAADKVKNGEPISKDDTRLLTEVVSEEVNPQTLQKVIEATEKIPDDATNTLEVAPLIAAKKESADRIKELQSEKATLDENYQTQKDNEIAAVEKLRDETNNEIKSITEQKKQDTRTEEPTIENVEGKGNLVEEVADVSDIGAKLPENATVYKTITDSDGTKWDVVSANKSGINNYDIYRNGEKQSAGARKATDIEPTIDILRQNANEDFEGLLNWEKVGQKGKTERTNDFKDYTVEVSRKFDSSNKPIGANLTISKRNSDGTLTITKQKSDYKTIAEAKRDAVNQVKQLSETLPPTVENKPQSILGSVESLTEALNKRDKETDTTFWHMHNGRFGSSFKNNKEVAEYYFKNKDFVNDKGQRYANIEEIEGAVEVLKDIADKAGGDKGVGAVLPDGEPRNLIGATVVAKKELTGVGGKKKQFEGQVKIVGEEKDSQGNTLYDGRYTDSKGNQRSILLRGEDIKTSDLGVKKEGEGAALPEQKFTKKGKELADKIRGLKSKPIELKDENGNPIIIEQAGFDFNPIIEAIAKGVEKGGELIDVIKTELEKAKWYQNLTDKGKDAVTAQLRAQFEGEVPKEVVKEAKEPTIVGTKEKAVLEGEPPKEVSGIKKALVSDEIIEGVNLDKIGDKEMMDLGRKILDTKEVNPEAIVTNIVSTGKGVLTPKEVVALITHKADLDTALREAYRKKNEVIERGEQRGEDLGVINAEINALEGKIHDFDVMAVITANQQSMAFRLRKMMLDKDYNVVTQIEKYKANNDGYIPPEVEARFRELGKELDVVKGKLAKAEDVVRLREEQDAAASITEDVGRKKGKEISEEEVIQKVKEGIEAEINDIHSKLSPERKRFADKAIAALDRLQEKIRKNTYSDATGMIAIVDAGITTIKRAIKAGVVVADAIELGIKKIKEQLSKQGIKNWEKENDFRKDVTEGFEAEKISTVKPKRDVPEIKDDGSIKIPNEMIRGLVERGITEIGELTDAVHTEVIKELPGATTRQVRDAITDYGRTVNPTADVIQIQVNAAKRVGRLLSELEDLQNFKQKAKGKQAFKITEKERDLKRQINALTKNAGLTPEQTSTKAQKERVKNRITELEKRLREKDFAKKSKPVKSTDTELVELNKEKERLQEEFDKAQYENELKNRTFWQKAEDVALELISGLPRALVASIDFSAIFIQGLRRLATSPVQSAKALGESFRQFASEKRQNDWMNNLKAQEFYPLLEASKLAITKTEGKISKREELFISNWVNLIYNGLGKVITFGHKPSYNIWKRINPYKATGRAFTGYTNAIRVSAFLEGAKFLEKKGLTYESNPKDFQKWADYVNTTTGRGSLGRAETSAGWLSTIFFAPRKMIADLKLFTPYVFVYYARFPKAIRQKAVLDYAQAITTVVAANALLWAARRDEDDTEADQFWNPISTNFLTHKFGNTALEITGGMRTNIVFMSRLLSGKYTDQYGFKSKLGDRYGKQINTRQDLVENFLSNKFSPLISLANKKLDEKKGLELEKSEYTNLAIPMWLQDVRELYKENPKEIGAMMNLLAVFGASVRTIDTHTADSIKHNGKDVELTTQQQEEFSNIYTEKESEYLEKLVNDNIYINSNEEEKIKLKQMINDAARNDAQKEIKNQYPQDFTPETESEKVAREKEAQDLEDLKIKLGIKEAPTKSDDRETEGRTQESGRKETAVPSR